MTRRAVVALALLAGLAAAAPAGAQQVAARFEITAVGDSTFTFATGSQRWVNLRSRGIVVDPAKRDALVARFRIIGLSDGAVTALVTGQTGSVTTQHFVVITPPPPPRWNRRSAVVGAAVGVVAGAVLGAVLF